MTFNEWEAERYGGSMLSADKHAELENCYYCGYKQGQLELQSQLTEKNKQIEEIKESLKSVLQSSQEHGTLEELNTKWKTALRLIEENLEDLK